MMMATTLETTLATPSELPDLPALTTLVYGGEAARIGEKKTQKLIPEILQIQITVKSLLDKPAQINENSIAEKYFAGILQLLRIQVNLLFQAASQDWSLVGHAQQLTAAKAKLLECHLNQSLTEVVSKLHFGLRGETYEFAIELARDVAKYLDKLAKLTGQNQYRTQAALVLNQVCETFESQSQKPEAYFLAKFEAANYLDLAGDPSVEADNVEHWANELWNYGQQSIADSGVDSGNSEKPKYAENWDRYAAAAWWYFEFGLRHRNAVIMDIALQRVNWAVAAGGQKSRSKYLAARMIANLADKLRHGQFVLATPSTKEKISEQLSISV